MASRWWCWWRTSWASRLRLLPLLLLSIFAGSLFSRSQCAAAVPVLETPLPADAGPVLDAARGGDLGQLPSLGPERNESPPVPAQRAGARASLSTSSAPKSDIAVLAFLDGTILLADKSRKIHGEFSSGPPLSTSYQALTDDDTDDGYFLYCGDDWKLYEYRRVSGKKELGITAEEYVNMTPIVSVDGGVTVGGNRSTEFLFDAKSGKVISPYWTDGFQVPARVGSLEEKSIVPKLQTESNFEFKSATAGIFKIVRRDYAISRYTNTRKLSWSMTVSYIEASLCLGFDCTNSKKLPVYQVHEPNPFSLGPAKELQLAPADFRKESRHRPTFDENHVPSPMLDRTEEVFKLLNYSHEAKNNESNGVYADASEVVHSNRSSSNHSSKFREGFLPWYAVSALRYVIPACLILGLISYTVIRKIVKSEKQTVDLVKKQSPISKKRRARKSGNNKNNAIVQKSDLCSQSEGVETSKLVGAEENDRDLLFNHIKTGECGDGRWVGKIFVSTTEIAKGSNGTVVFEGFHDGRPVAVKRLVRTHHDMASKEIQNLIASDRHPNIIRWFGAEYDPDFVYLALERCSCSLNDLIQFYADTSASKSVNECKIQFSLPKGAKGLKLWKENGCPSSMMIKLMRDVVSGLAHLHELGIIHRDVKPQNVLISFGKSLSAKLSDMGISKRLPDDMSSLGHHATGHGSSGWQAPEQLLRGRQTRAVDLFSLGCVLFFCLTEGRHPFGNTFERDTNILNNRVDLFLVEHIPEAVHLFTDLLNPDMDLRPKAAEVLQHPLFWDSEKRLSFFRDTSDMVELEDRENGSELLQALENIAPVAFGGKWGDKLDALFVTDMGRYRKYRFESTRDLLRVIRNKLNHFRELPENLQVILTPMPEGFDNYFRNLFPKLFIEVYKVVYKYCREDDFFKKYFHTSVL